MNNHDEEEEAIELPVWYQSDPISHWSSSSSSWGSQYSGWLANRRQLSTDLIPEPSAPTRPGHRRSNAVSFPSPSGFLAAVGLSANTTDPTTTIPQQSSPRTGARSPGPHTPTPEASAPRHRFLASKRHVFLLISVVLVLVTGIPITYLGSRGFFGSSNVVAGSLGIAVLCFGVGVGVCFGRAVWLHWRSRSEGK